MVPGTQIGAYRLLQQIGEGGMGAVWLAEHAMLGRRAAIKLLHPMFTARPDIVTRFFNEARAATAIADPGIVQIFDFGQHVDGTAYIAMEMLEGEPLDKRLGRLGRMPITDALRLLRQIASTLGVAHQRGIVHRDLKPENIYLVRDPEVIGGERAKILDFGIAKLTGDPNIKTNTSAVMGTPAYMSPEQCRGAGQVDQRSDVYALGCMLFKLITGGPPFDAEGAGEIIAMHLRELPPTLSSRVHGIPPELDALVQHCLAKDPAYRYASGAELAAAVAGVLGVSWVANLPVTGEGAFGRAPSSVVSATTLSAAASVAAGASTAGRSSKSPRVALFAIIGTLIAGGSITAAVMARGKGAPVPTKPAGPPTADPAITSPPALPAGAPVASTRPAVPPAPSPPSPPSSPPDPKAELSRPMKAALGSFVAWAHDHAGAPCPRASLLGPPVNDPWGHPLELTCTDQPANQIVGAISAGPDGAIGTQDDIGSWQLGRDVTDIVHGARWAATARPAPTSPVRPTRPARPVGRPRIENDDIPRER
jgi:serine/threonine-protein kinase